MCLSFIRTRRRLILTILATCKQTSSRTMCWWTLKQMWLSCATWAAQRSSRKAPQASHIYAAGTCTRYQGALGNTKNRTCMTCVKHVHDLCEAHTDLCDADTQMYTYICVMRTNFSRHFHYVHTHPCDMQILDRKRIFIRFLWPNMYKCACLHI